VGLSQAPLALLVLASAVQVLMPSLPCLPVPHAYDPPQRIPSRFMAWGLGSQTRCVLLDFIHEGIVEIRLPRRL
jgi:hypothetical protein